MEIHPDSDTPIFSQIASGITDAILAGAFPEGSQIPSITEFSISLKVNPATALKGIGILVEEGILYKKRGLGMFVAEGASELLKRKRGTEFNKKYVADLIDEAKRLCIGKDELIAMIMRGYDK